MSTSDKEDWKFDHPHQEGFEAASESVASQLVDRPFENGFEAGCECLGCSEPPYNPYRKGSVAHGEFESGVQAYRTHAADWNPGEE